MDRFLKKMLRKVYNARKHPCHIRSIQERDLPAVAEIERLSFPNGWSEESFRTVFSRDGFGEVAECNQQVAGFIVYKASPANVIILNLAVHPAQRRQGVGSQIVKYLFNHLLFPWSRRTILLGVPETLVGAQLFFRSQNFYWIYTLKNRLRDSDEDVYIMQCVQSCPGETVAIDSRVSTYFMDD